MTGSRIRAIPIATDNGLLVQQYKRSKPFNIVYLIDEKVSLGSRTHEVRRPDRESDKQWISQG